MNVIRIRRRVDSDTLHLPELQALLGKTVEIIIREETTAPVPSNLDFFLALAPREPPLEPQELAALRADPTYQKIWPLLDLVGKDVVDAAAIAELRAASMI